MFRCIANRGQQSRGAAHSYDREVHPNRLPDSRGRVLNWWGMSSASLTFWRTASPAAKKKAFIAEARKIHGRKYDYSQVVYKTALTPVKVVCRRHGAFYPTPANHYLNKIKPSGCPKCGIEKRSRETFLAHKSAFVTKARKVHGRKYDYAQTDYTGIVKSLSVNCRRHGRFSVIAASHLRGSGCPVCRRENLWESDGYPNFVRRALRIHGRKYDYEKARKRSGGGKVTIVCPEHGEFVQLPNTHLNGHGCAKCGIANLANKFKLTRAEFVRRAKKVHGSKFKYLGGYKNQYAFMTISCPVHGIFKQRAIDHMNGHGCKKCGVQQRAAGMFLTTEEFVAKARSIHGSRYKYPAPYRRNDLPVKIVCPKHGDFRQTPNSHLQGQGCPRCIESLGERMVAAILQRHRIKFTPQHRFPDCADTRPLRFDFWLPCHKTAIEFDGPQHFDKCHFFGGAERYESTKRRDRIKTAYARKKKIRLIRVKYSVRDVETFLVKKLGLA